jgi:hypothetical protein
MEHDTTYKRRIREIYNELLNSKDSVETLTHLAEFVKSGKTLGPSYLQPKTNGKKKRKLQNGFHVFFL